MTTEHPASEAPQMKIDEDGTSRLETEQERIERIKERLAIMDFRPGDQVDCKAGDQPPRRAEVIGREGDNIYVRYADKGTQSRVRWDQLTMVAHGDGHGSERPLITPGADLPERTPLPGPADLPGSTDLKRVTSSTEYAPDFEAGERVTTTDANGPLVAGTVKAIDRKGGKVLVQSAGNPDMWLPTERLARRSTLTRQQAAERFISGIMDRPAKQDHEIFAAPRVDAKVRGYFTPAPLKVAIQRLHPQAVTPTQAKASDAGYDLCSITEDIIPAGGRLLFRTGIALAIPEGYVGLVKPRSGLAVKHGIDVLAGVIDSGYRGEVIVALLNTGDEDYEVAAGDRIAQLLVQRVADVAFEEGELPPSERADGGFGSTGKGAL